MNNQVTVSVEFSFKGQQFTPSIELDPDKYMQSDGHLPDFYILLANANDIGLYSYEFEMLQAETVLFLYPKGLIADYVHDDNLDKDGFEAAWHKQKLGEIFQGIARQYMSIEQLEHHPDLEAALMAAYIAGKTTTD